ncbi:hypothetical protein N7540_005092 [Penicillium herquei]|nr:hypothetical protein N7540_005092 [Penicillium herquei]
MASVSRTPSRQSPSLEGLEQVVPPRVMSITAHRSEITINKPLTKSYTGDSLKAPSESSSAMYSDSSETASSYDDSNYGTPADLSDSIASYLPILVRTGSDDFTGLLDLPAPTDGLKDSSPVSPLPYIHPLSLSPRKEEESDTIPIAGPPSPFSIDISTSIFGTAPRKNTANPNHLTAVTDLRFDDSDSRASSPSLSPTDVGLDEEDPDYSTATSPIDIDASSVILGTSAHYGRPLQWKEPNVESGRTSHASHYFREKKWDLFPELGPSPSQVSGRESPGHGKEGRLNVTAKQPKWYSMNMGRKSGVRQSFMTYVNKISHHSEEKEKREKHEPKEPQESPIEVPRVHSRRFTGPMGPLNTRTTDPIREDDEEEEAQELDEFHAQLLTSSTSTSNFHADESRNARERKSAFPSSTPRKHSSVSWQLPSKNKTRASQPPPVIKSSQPQSAMKSRPPSAMKSPPSAMRSPMSPSSEAKKHSSVSWQLPTKNSMRASQPVPAPAPLKTNKRPESTPVRVRPASSRPTQATKRSTFAALPALQTSAFGGGKKKSNLENEAERRREEIRGRIKFVGSVNPHLCKPQKDPWSPLQSGIVPF